MACSTNPTFLGCSNISTSTADCNLKLLLLRAEDSKQSTALISLCLKSVLNTVLGSKYRIQDRKGLAVRLVHPHPGHKQAVLNNLLNPSVSSVEDVLMGVLCESRKLCSLTVSATALERKAKPLVKLFKWVEDHDVQWEKAFHLLLYHTPKHYLKRRRAPLLLKAPSVSVMHLRTIYE